MKHQRMKLDISTSANVATSAHQYVSHEAKVAKVAQEKAEAPMLGIDLTVHERDQEVKLGQVQTLQQAHGVPRL